MAVPALAPVPAALAVVASAPASQPSAASTAGFSAFAPAPGPAPSRKRRGVPRSTLFILDADYATLTIPDPGQPDEGTLEARPD